MKITRILLAPLLLAIAMLTPSVTAAQSPTTPITNASVIKLVRAGFKDKTVIAIIHTRPNRFELDPEHLIELKRSGVSENVILAMLSQSDPFFPDEDLSFGVTRKRQSSESPGDGDDIFGSSSGSSGETKGRGMNGSVQGQSSTTGSATVRILRPPADSNGSTLKLEKTATLNNGSIINLVEAGFSEGTIIKRIEESPVDFDLTVSKIEELRRHRVSEAVIQAMRNAMNGATPSTETNSTHSSSK